MPNIRRVFAPDVGCLTLHETSRQAWRDSPFCSFSADTQLPAQQAPADQSSYTLKVNTDLVLSNVVVRSKKTGEIVRGLTANDFTILENGKPQKISTFDFESVDQAVPLNEATITGMAGGLVKSAKTIAATTEQLRNHRLIVLFFDLTSMQAEDIDRSVDAAKNFINQPDAGGGPGCRSLAEYQPVSRSGFHCRQKCPPASDLEI